MRIGLVLFLILLGGQVADLRGEDKPAGKLPTVVLYGDSIRLSYAPVVAKQLEGQATVVSPAGNGGDSDDQALHSGALLAALRAGPTLAPWASL